MASTTPGGNAWDLEGRPPDQATAQMRDARDRELTESAKQLAEATVADAKAYTNAAIAAAKIGGGDMTVATIQAMIQDELGGGNYTGPRGRGVLSFGPPDESGVVIVYYDDGSSGELQLLASGGGTDEAALLAAYEAKMGA